MKKFLTVMFAGGLLLLIGISTAQSHSFWAKYKVNPVPDDVNVPQKYLNDDDTLECCGCHGRIPSIPPVGCEGDTGGARPSTELAYDSLQNESNVITITGGIIDIDSISDNGCRMEVEFDGEIYTIRGLLILECRCDIDLHTELQDPNKQYTVNLRAYPFKGNNPGYKLCEEFILYEEGESIAECSDIRDCPDS